MATPQGSRRLELKLNSQQEIIKPPEYQEFVIEGDEFTHWKQEWWKRVEAYYLLNS
jgi:hypothetical protein